MMYFSAIAAIGVNGEIGFQNKLPWDVPEDLKYFRALTQNTVVVMGRKTFESIGRPLPQRVNIVLSQTRKELHPTSVDSLELGKSYWVNNVRDILMILERQEVKRKVFIIGGEQVYRAFLPLCERVYLTQIDQSLPEADAYFPEWDKIVGHSRSGNLEKFRDISSIEKLTFADFLMDKEYISKQNGIKFKFKLFQQIK